MSSKVPSNPSRSVILSVCVHTREGARDEFSICLELTGAFPPKAVGLVFQPGTGYFWLREGGDACTMAPESTSMLSPCSQSKRERAGGEPAHVPPSPRKHVSQPVHVPCYYFPSLVSGLTVIQCSPGHVAAPDRCYQSHSTEHRGTGQARPGSFRFFLITSKWEAVPIYSLQFQEFPEFLSCS